MVVLASFAPRVEALDNPILPSNTPYVSAVTSTTAAVSVPGGMLDTFSSEQKAGIYFEYYQTQQVCIAIYPTPEYCLPKKSIKGQTSVILRDLKPATAYTVSYKIDNTIACIQAPCPGNEVQSGYTEFTTLAGTGTSGSFSRNLGLGARGSDVTMLQDLLREKGYFNRASTGYFGYVTYRSVQNFQRSQNIIQTGFVGPLTRAVLNGFSVNAGTEEYFSGTIQAVSTGCFTDGECSVTIGGKKVVTMIGWSQMTVGSIKGSVNNIGDIQTSKIGSQANVYAKKTTDGYTLYGNANYYIEVL